MDNTGDSLDGRYGSVRERKEIISKTARAMWILHKTKAGWQREPEADGAVGPGTRYIHKGLTVRINLTLLIGGGVGVGVGGWVHTSSK